MEFFRKPAMTKHEAELEVNKFSELNPNFASSFPQSSNINIHKFMSYRDSMKELEALSKLYPTDFIKYDNKIHCKDKYAQTLSGNDDFNEKMENIFYNPPSNEELANPYLYSNEKLAKDLISIKYDEEQFKIMIDLLKGYLDNPRAKKDSKIIKALRKITMRNLDTINNINSYEKFLKLDTSFFGGSRKRSRRTRRRRSKKTKKRS